MLVRTPIRRRTWKPLKGYTCSKGNRSKESSRSTWECQPQDHHRMNEANEPAAARAQALRFERATPKVGGASFSIVD